MFEELIYGFILILSSLMVNYFMIKRYVSDQKIMEKIDLILSNLVNDVEMQKKVYLLGTLLGSGIAKGSGIQGSGGKFKLQDIIAQGASAFISNILQVKQSGIPQQTKEGLP